MKISLFGISTFVAIGLIVPSITFAAPEIINVSGTIADGQVITIKGTGFGVNGPDIKLYDSFESASTWDYRATSKNYATIGQWDAQDGGFTADTIGYSSLSKISGSKSLQILNTAIDGGPRINLPATNREVFFTVWAYVPVDKWWPGATSDTAWNPANWKFIWLKHNNNSSTGGSDLILPRYLGITGTPSYLTAGVGGNNSPINIGYSGEGRPKIRRGEWFRISAWVKGREDNTGEIHLWELTPSQGIEKRIDINNAQTIKTTDVNGPYYFNTLVMNGFARTGPNDAIYFDDMYVAVGAAARARVEIGDASTYGASTNLSVATPTLWGDSTILATVRKGLFADGQQAYIYLTDENGNMNMLGYPILFGLPADMVAPAAPSGLNVE